MKSFLLLPLLLLACSPARFPHGQQHASRPFTKLKMDAHTAPKPEVIETEIVVPPPPPFPPELEDFIIEEIIEFVEVSPEFPGGQQELYRFFSKEVHYPQIALDMGIEGTVYVQFKVLQDGSIEDVSIVRGVDSFLDAEAVRVVKKMPKWAPAESNGRKISKIVVVPVAFKIN